MAGDIISSDCKYEQRVLSTLDRLDIVYQKNKQQFKYDKTGRKERCLIHEFVCQAVEYHPGI